VSSLEHNRTSPSASANGRLRAHYLDREARQKAMGKRFQVSLGDADPGIRGDPLSGFPVAF